MRTVSGVRADSGNAAEPQDAGIQRLRAELQSTCDDVHDYVAGKAEQLQHPARADSPADAATKNATEAIRDASAYLVQLKATIDGLDRLA